MGPDGTCWDGGDRWWPADVRFRKAQPEGITAPTQAAAETSARGHRYLRVQLCVVTPGRRSDGAAGGLGLCLWGAGHAAAGRTSPFQPHGADVEALAEGLLTDRFDAHAVDYAAYDSENRIVGSMRVVPDGPPLAVGTRGRLRACTDCS